MNKNSNDNRWQRKLASSTSQLARWTLAWVLTMALATFGPLFLWTDQALWTLGAIVLNTLMGLGMILASIKHLQSLDEMQQRIQLEAMGLTLGVVLVIGMSYSNLDISNLIPMDAEISILVMIMGLTFMTALFFGAKRYK